MIQRRWDPCMQQPCVSFVLELPGFFFFFFLMGGSKFDRSETRAVPKPEIISCLVFQLGYLSWCMLDFQSKKNKSMALKSGFHDFLVKQYQRNSLHVCVMFSVWQVIWVTLSQKFQIKEKQERMWNIYIWKPPGNDRQERGKYWESDWKETCVAELSNINFPQNI